MRTTSWQIRILVAGCVASLLTAPLPAAVTAPHQETVPTQLSRSTPAIESPSQHSNPEATKPAANAATTDNLHPAAPNANLSQPTDQNGRSGTSQSASKPQDSVTQPVGAAAAPYEKNVGVAASSPAGAVIAPAKQRRARSFLIKIGIVVGAGVAIGTVVALSHVSPSQPH